MPVQEGITPVNVKIGLWLACGVCCQVSVCTGKAACLESMHGCSRGPTRQAVAFLSHGNMAHPLVVGVGTEVCPVCDVIEVLDAILCDHVPVSAEASKLKECSVDVTHQIGVANRMC